MQGQQAVHFTFDTAVLFSRYPQKGPSFSLFAGDFNHLQELDDSITLGDEFWLQRVYQAHGLPPTEMLS